MICILKSIGEAKDLNKMVETVSKSVMKGKVPKRGGWGRVSLLIGGISAVFLHRAGPRREVPPPGALGLRAPTREGRTVPLAPACFGVSEFRSEIKLTTASA